MKIVMEPSWRNVGAWFIGHPYETPDHIHYARMAEAIKKIINGDYSWNRKNINANGEEWNNL